jgi:hypothetical protein
MNPRERWSQVLTLVGRLAMLVGALDPLEGAALILPGSALTALGAYLSQADRRWFTLRVWIFALIAIGVAALFGTSAAGGIGGNSGRSGWWGLLYLPYLAGWSWAIWGPGNPRWVPLAGIGVGLWYLSLAAIILMRATSPRPGGAAVLIALGLVGVATLAGCVWRLRPRGGASLE